MSVHLVSFATSEFALAMRGLIDSARAFGVDRVDPWDPARLRATPFYPAHRELLDRPRGAGYWLWKPYIIQSLLDQAAPGDIVVYADAAISVIRPLDPLFDLCRRRGGVLLFRGHYDAIFGPPHVCAAWTKRDAFVLMGCDAEAFYQAPMVDASLVVLERDGRAQTLVREWLEYCRDPRIVSDDENSCALANRPEFIAHRHDQSVLSLLAARHGLELFRGPSQYGNHCKPPALREAGEWKRQPYGTETDGYANSPYGTLLFHHRKRALLPDTVTLAPGRSTVHDLVARIGRGLRRPPRVLQIGVDDAFDMAGLRRAWGGAEVTMIEPPIVDSGQFPRRGFNVVLSSTSGTAALLEELTQIRQRALLDSRERILCWSGMDGVEGWAAFRAMQANPATYAGPGESLRFGLIDGSRDGRARPRTIGLMVSRHLLDGSGL
jgi:hypothetical protein